MTVKTELTHNDILDTETYIKIREERRAKILIKKKLRRVAVGPYSTFYFESYDTMWYQVQEMLRIEKGGEPQLQDELTAYNPLIPKGDELIATVMFEINNPGVRSAVLSSLGGVEEHISIQVGDEKISAKPEQDIDRTNSEGKASSVQFVHFKFSTTQIKHFNDVNTIVNVGIDHPKYGHTAVLSRETCDELAKDFI